MIKLILSALLAALLTGCGGGGGGGSGDASTQIPPPSSGITVSSSTIPTVVYYGSIVDMTISATNISSPLLKYDWGIQSNCGSIQGNGEFARWEVTSAMQEMDCLVNVNIKDNSSNETNHSKNVRVMGTPPGNTAPVIDKQVSGEASVFEKTVVQYSVTAHDANNDVLYYIWQTDSDCGEIHSEGNKGFWITPAVAAPKTCDISVTVKDIFGASVSSRISATVNPSSVIGNNPPVLKNNGIIGEPTSLSGVPQGYSIQATDTDGDKINYFWTTEGVDCGKVVYNDAGIGMWYSKLSVNDMFCTLIAYAYDERGGITKASRNIQVLGTANGCH